MGIVLDHMKDRATGDGRVGLGQEIGLGFALGVSSGFAVKKAARTLLFAGGAFFALMQGLRYRGWIKFNVEKIEADLAERLDFDADGKLDPTVVDEKEREMLLFLESGVPCGSAFGAGFLLGVRL